MTATASSPSARIPPTPREVDRDSRTAAAGTGLRRQPPFTCAGCGAELPPSRRRGRPRKWCSERCRKDQYAGVCEVCGGPTDGTTPSRGVARVCQSCREWDRASIIDAIQRWAEEHGGIPPRKVDFHASAGYPPEHTVARHFGKWNNALLAAEFGLHMDRRPETQAWIEQQLRAGRPTAEIADALGVTPDAIHERMRCRGTTVVKVRTAA